MYNLGICIHFTGLDSAKCIQTFWALLSVITESIGSNSDAHLY